VATDLAALGPAAELDFSGFVFDKAVLHECNYNWKTFIEVYLEDYHVGPFHPGLGSFVTCDDLRWEFGREHSVQTVGMHDALKKAGSPAYRRWHEAVLKYRGGQPPAHGAIWLTYYPTVMVEWYPHVLVVSTLFPRGPRKTLNLVEFFYPRRSPPSSASSSRPSRPPTWRPASRTTRSANAWTPAAGAVMERGDDEVGPYQSPMEDGMQHFHEWYRRRMGMARRA
jgi:choline monooxygenase